MDKFNEWFDSEYPQFSENQDNDFCKTAKDFSFKAWQSRQAEVEEKDKKLKSVEQILIELKESMTNFKEMDLYDKGVRVVTDCIIRDLEKAQGDNNANS
ncbi:hypothetical protein [Acinetobacter bereziniae]|uniref:hypothetical protein n=1 Tax=Acinetobacter bereziniae TaxID=106648 RepID=UPI003AF7B8AC